MHDLLARLPAEAGHGLVHIVVDTPSGSPAKFKYDATLRAFTLSRLLPRGMAFPYNFGSIPGTVADDGDALDVVVLTDVPLFVGCVVTARLVGVINAVQGSDPEIRNDRLLAVPVTEANPAWAEDIGDIGEERLRDLEQFFVSYNRIHGRRFEPTGRGSAGDARATLDAACRRYRDRGHT